MKYVAILTALALGSAAFVVSSAADAHPKRGAMVERLKAADADADGKLSRAEAATLPRLAERFDTLDANRDGFVGFDELRAARKGGHRNAMMKRLDADADGRVSKAEALSAAAQRFDRLDANQDGFITTEEAALARGKHRGHGNRS